jgi:ATP synthase protein I
MKTQPGAEPPDTTDNMAAQVGSKAARRIKARGERRHNLWFGLGMFGLVGWSVAIPTLAGIALGLWIDGTWPSHVSWTLTLLFVGMVLGCLNAWRWLKREGRL